MESSEVLACCDFLTVFKVNTVCCCKRSPLAFSHNLPLCLGVLLTLIVQKNACGMTSYSYPAYWTKVLLLTT